MWKEGRRAGAVFPLASLAAAVVFAMQPGPTAVWRHSGIGAGRAQVPAGASALRNWENGRENAASCGRPTAWNRASAIARHHGIALIVNGKSDGSALGDASTQIMLGLVAAAAHPKPQPHW